MLRFLTKCSKNGCQKDVVLYSSSESGKELMLKYKEWYCEKCLKEFRKNDRFNWHSKSDNIVSP